jgi:S-formylglutathione hydrolase
MSGSWTTESIAGRPAVVFDPGGYRPARFGVMFLHDLDGQPLRDQPNWTRWLGEQQLACICPSGGLSWWTDRICREFDPAITAEAYLLNAVMPAFDERWRVRARAVGIVGIGVGGQGALRLAFRHPERFPVVAALAAALDYHELYGFGTTLDEMYESKEQCRQDTALMHIPPSGYPPHIFFAIDPDDHRWFRGNDRLDEKLTALGIPREKDFVTRGGGHTWVYFNHMAERVGQFLVSGLEQESRRLL